MRLTLIVIAAMFACLSGFAQGTINFYNRHLTDPETGAIYNAPIYGPGSGATAQLYIVMGTGAAATYTPIPGVQTFRAAPNNGFFVGPLVVSVPGLPAGTSGVRVVIRVSPSYCGSQSHEITLGPLGGIPEIGPPIVPPNLDGLQSMVSCPEPSTFTLGLLGTVALFFRRRPKNGLPQGAPLGS